MTAKTYSVVCVLFRGLCLHRPERCPVRTQATESLPYQKKRDFEGYVVKRKIL
jgi:hypothetical protein